MTQSKLPTRISQNSFFGQRGQCRI
jgi:hypothetical protein